MPLSVQQTRTAEMKAKLAESLKAVPERTKKAALEAINARGFKALQDIPEIILAMCDALEKMKETQ